MISGVLVDKLSILRNYDGNFQSQNFKVNKNS